MTPPEESARAAVLPFDLYRDLLGKPFEEVGRCWGLVVEVYRRMGVHVAGDLTDAWEPAGGEPVAGDLVMMDAGGPDPHAGIYLGDRRVLHTAQRKRASVAVASLGALERGGLLRGFWRHRGRFQPPTVVPDASDVTVVYCADVMRPMNREIRRVPHAPGRPVQDYAPTGANVAVLDGRIVGLAELGGIVPMPGTVLVFGTFPGNPALVGLGIGLILSFLSTLFAPAVPGTPKEETASPTFDLSGLRNTAQVGIAQPLLYGEHRVGGNFISAFQKSDGNGRSILYLLMFVSRGPIESIAGLTADADNLTGAAIPDDIQIDGSPAKNYGAQVSIRLGSSDQAPIPGFNEVVSAITYTKTLLPADPFTHQTTAEVDGFDLIVSYPLGLYNIDSNGNVGPRSVGFTIRWRVTGTTTWTSTTQVQTGNRRGAFTRQFQLRSLTLAKYDIQIERFAASAGFGSPPWPETTSNKESRSDLINVNEIVSETLWYPDKALVSIIVTGTDQLSGSLPTITVKAKGLKVWVWDGVSETVPAFGSAKVYSDNPAWCVMDMLLNPNHGLSRNGRLKLNNIGLAEFDAWADNCDLLVSDGRGGTVKRATLDLVVDATQKGWEYIQSIALSHWARLFIAGNEIRAVVEKVASPVAILNMGNLKDVSFSFKGKRSRPNVVEVSYFNEETNYEADTVLWPPGGTIATGAPIVKESVQAVGVTRACHAYRLAHWRWNLFNLAIRSFEGTTGLENIHLVPGDLVEVQHEAPKDPVVSASGRVLASTASTVTLDQDVYISGTFNIKVRITVAGVESLVEKRLANVGAVSRGTPIAIFGAGTWTNAPSLGDPYQCGQGQTYYRPYRLMALETTPDTLERKMAGTQYSDAIYDDDPGTVETFTDTMPDPRMLPGAVSNLKLTETSMLSSDGTVQDMIRVEFTQSAQWFGADVFYRVRTPSDSAERGEWILSTCCSSEVATIGPFGKGVFVEVAVAAVSKQGSRPHPDVSPQAGLYTLGRLSRPGDPRALSVDVAEHLVYVTITPPADARDVAGYEVRLGTTWAGSLLLGRRVPSEWVCPLTWVGTETVRVRSISRSGILSAVEATASPTVNILPGVYVLDATQAEDPAWGGAKTNTVVSGTSLILSGSNSGTYAISKLTPTGGVERTMIEVTAGLQNVQRQMDECAFRFDDAVISNVPMNAFYLNGFEVIGSGFTIQDLSAIPLNGLVASCMTMDGMPIDIFGGLTPDISWDDTSGSKAYHVGESTLPSLDAVLTLRRPHSRYVPEASGMEENVYSV